MKRIGRISCNKTFNTIDECNNCHLLGHTTCEKEVGVYTCALCNKRGHIASNSLCPSRCRTINKRCYIHDINASRNSNSIEAWHRFTNQFRSYCYIAGCYEMAQFTIHIKLCGEDFYRLVPMCLWHSRSELGGLQLICDFCYPILCNSHKHMKF